jgi:hypothetical protein
MKHDKVIDLLNVTTKDVFKLIHLYEQDHADPTGMAMSEWMVDRSKPDIYMSYIDLCVMLKHEDIEGKNAAELTALLKGVVRKRLQAVLNSLGD